MFRFRIIRMAGGSFWAVVVVAAMFCLGAVVWADGGYYKRMDRLGFVPVEGSEQRAWIYCHGGIEHLAVALAIPEKRPSEGLWVLPVKGRPEQVRVELLERMPVVSGQDLLGVGRKRVESVAYGMLMTQVWPVLPMSCLLPSLNRSREGVEITSEVEKFGLVSQVVKAESLEALEGHLRSLSEQAPTAGQLRSFEPYLAGEYVFVVTSVKSAEEVERISQGGMLNPAVFVTFPSERPWYPMKGTRLYGEEATPVQVRVMGDWQLAQGVYVREGTQRWFGRVSGRDVPVEAAMESERYVLVDLFGLPAKQFEEEMEFVPGVPRTVRGSEFLMSDVGTWVVWGLLHACQSVLAGAVAGWTRGDSRRGGWRMGVKLGLGNLLTIFGVVAMVRRENRRAAGSVKPYFVRVFTITYIMLPLVILWMVGVFS